MTDKFNVCSDMYLIMYVGTGVVKALSLTYSLVYFRTMMVKALSLTYSLGPYGCLGVVM
jgi:hypothetical protein